MWQNQSLCNLLSCSDVGCDQVFEDAKNINAHLLEGSEKTGDNDALGLSMDNMKSLFVSKKSFWKEFSLIEDFLLIERDFASNIKSLFASKVVYSSHKHATISNNQVFLAEPLLIRHVRNIPCWQCLKNLVRRYHRERFSSK